jgi:AraC-like DNA-binding protein
MSGTDNRLHKSDMPFSLTLSDLDVFPSAVLRIRCDPGWQLDSSWSSRLHDYDLWYVWGGVGRMITSAGTVELRPGVGIWMSPGRRYEALQDSRKRLCVTAVHFNLGYKGKTLRPSEFRPPVEQFEPLNPAYFDEVMSRIVSLASSAEGTHISGLLLKALLMEITSAACVNQDTKSPLYRHHRQKLGEILAEIRDHPDRARPVEELAKQCGYSPDHFTRIFRSVTGHSPKRFVIKGRMERAAALLKESSHTVTEIADLLGYQNLGFFSRQFRDHFGISPIEFRQLRRGRKGSPAQRSGGAGVLLPIL